MSLNSCRQLVKEELAATNQLIVDALASDIPLAAEIAHHVFDSGGKRLRPMLVLLMAKAFNYQGDQHIKLAAIIELLHTATLLHDDVVDDSHLRRGKPTANDNWGNEASVLVGDLLYAKAFQFIADLQHHPVNQLIARATSLIVEGEVLQLSHCNDIKTTEQDYFDIIERKTGQLFAVATACIPCIMGLEQINIDSSYSYGCDLGIAFQIMDDALDYDASSEELGKNIGDDLAEGKPTLPLLYILKEGTPEQIKLTEQAIEAHGDTCIDTIIKTLHDTKAIQYAQQTAIAYSRQAIDQLNTLPESPAKTALIELANFASNRKS